jgi:hypothetical protein
MDGLPGRLPAGEQVLWQAKPDWRSLARHAFKLRAVSLYFTLLVFWRIAGSLSAGHDLRYAVVSAASCVLLGAAGVALFCLFAWLISRTTTYTITQKRIVITYGMALPKSLNLPFSAVEAVDMKINVDGTGELALRLTPSKRLSYLLLWPHVRSGKQGRPEPVLRCIPEPQAAAELLGRALSQSVSVAVPPRAVPAGAMARAA